MSIELHIIKADWVEHKDALRKIRETVFIHEQRVPREIEWDGEDERSTHFLAVTTMGHHIGCARLLSSGQIGRMAVLPKYRSNGIGARLLSAAVDEGEAQGFDRLFLHAQSYAQDFYRKGGFLPYGDEFEEAGIDHIAMELKLPLAFESSEASSLPRPVVRKQSLRPGLQEASAAPQTFDGLHDCSASLMHIVACAKRHLWILSPYLDHELFDTPALVDALSSLARSAPKVEIRILIFDSKPLIDRDHRVLQLARRLDEKIRIKVLAERADAQTSSFVCADLDAYWLLPSYEKYAGLADPVNPVTCRRLSETFERAWAKAGEDSELRVLHL